MTQNDRDQFIKRCMGEDERCFILRDDKGRICTGLKYPGDVMPLGHINCKPDLRYLKSL